MAKLTADDLKKKRAELKKNVYLRNGEFRGKIIVHMGTCGIATGAREILSNFLSELKRKEIENMMVTASGCAGLCSREPMATVEIQGEVPVKYVDLTPEKTERIVEEHVKSGRVIADYVLGRGSERGG